MIAWFLPLSNVAYYTVPSKILDYLIDAIGRVGMVTMPNATELLAKGDRGGIIKLGILANRYSLMLFAPCAVFLLAYAPELYALWISPAFAANSAYLIPLFLIGSTVVAGQHNSVSVLFGIGKHQRYSTCLLIEAVVTVVCFALVLPRFGLIGAACVSAVFTTLNRGGAACLLVSRELDISPFRYAASIYLRPLSAAAVCFAAMILLKPWLPGTTWSSLILAGAITAVIYFSLAVPLCLPREHRELLMNRVRHTLARQRA
jgi:O-antigen/teichoic acid export membrane protein